MTANEIENIIKNKQAIYDLTVDKTVNKIGNGNKLEKFPLIELPKYIQNNFRVDKISERYKNRLRKLFEWVFVKGFYD